jgi:gliding motility-associated-like protein
MRSFYVAFLFLIYASQINGFSQIFSSQSDYTEDTDYNTLNRTDSIYVFNQTETDVSSDIGSLEIYLPDNVSKFDFTWYLFDVDALDFNFQQIIKTDNDTNYSSIGNLGEGGYSVIYSNGTLTDTAYAWVYINNFIAKKFGIIDKDSEGKLSPKACEYIEIRVDLELDTFYYYDEISKKQHFFTTSYGVDISSDPAPDDWESVPSPRSYSLGRLRLRSSQPPTEDVQYFLEVSDKYGVTKYDTALYETIHTYAQLDTIPQWLKFDDGTDYYDDNEKMSAPLTVVFSPKESENASKYVWNFGGGTNDTTYLQPDSIEYTFFYIDPLKDLNPYTIVLTTFSEEGCVSADSVEIELENSELGVPPFFSPNGDQNNDVWRIYDASLRDFELWILNRWGRLVHKFNGEDIRDWQGWDGKFKDSNRDAPEGVYYFILTARGWDKKENDASKTQEYREHGFFHLYRNQRR